MNAECKKKIDFKQNWLVEDLIAREEKELTRGDPFTHGSRSPILCRLFQSITTLWATSHAQINYLKREKNMKKHEEKKQKNEK